MSLIHKQMVGRIIGALEVLPSSNRYIHVPYLELSGKPTSLKAGWFCDFNVSGNQMEQIQKAFGYCTSLAIRSWTPEMLLDYDLTTRQ